MALDEFITPPSPSSSCQVCILSSPPYFPSPLSLNSNILPPFVSLSLPLPSAYSSPVLLGKAVRRRCEGRTQNARKETDEASEPRCTGKKCNLDFSLIFPNNSSAFCSPTLHLRLSLCIRTGAADCLESIKTVFGRRKSWGGTVTR